jgi:hypothetical protein
MSKRNNHPVKVFANTTNRDRLAKNNSSLGYLPQVVIVLIVGSLLSLIVWLFLPTNQDSLENVIARNDVVTTVSNPIFEEENPVITTDYSEAIIKDTNGLSCQLQSSNTAPAFLLNATLQNLVGVLDDCN